MIIGNFTNNYTLGSYNTQIKVDIIDSLRIITSYRKHCSLKTNIFRKFLLNQTKGDIAMKEHVILKRDLVKTLKKLNLQGKMNVFYLGGRWSMGTLVFKAIKRREQYISGYLVNYFPIAITQFSGNQNIAIQLSRHQLNFFNIKEISSEKDYNMVIDYCSPKS